MSGRERPWLIWIVSLGLWTFIALASGLSMYEFQRSLGNAAASYPLSRLILLSYFFLPCHPVQREIYGSGFLAKHGFR
jgi:hypothetical protein